MRGRLSGAPLKAQLPTVMVGVLAIALTAIVLVLGASLRMAAIASAHNRLERATREIVATSTANITSRRPRYQLLATDTLIQRAAAGSRVDTASVASLLARAQVPDDSGLTIALWTRTGRLVAHHGNEVIMPRGDSGALPAPLIEAIRAMPRMLDTDTLGVTPLYRVGDRVCLWFVYPVRVRGVTVGFITHQRRPLGGAPGMGVTSAMSGTPITLYFRNESGTVWSLPGGRPVDPPVRAGAVREDRGVLFHERRVGPYPVIASLHITRDGVLIRPRGATRLVMLVSLVTLVIGAIISWIVARNLTRPLQELTVASRRVAAGNYSASVPVRGSAEIRRLAETFNAMAAEVEATKSGLEAERARALAANSAKSQFLTVMSHELRTPLNAIGGYVDLLDMELRGPLSEEQRSDLRRIKVSQQHLLGLISRVLDLARLEAGTVRYEPREIRMPEFLAEIDGIIAPLASAKSVRLRYENAELTVHADPEKLRQILLNVLGNAVRHTPPEGLIRIATAERDGMATIIVEDSGPGIPAEKREQVFEPFVQLERSLSQGHDGLGLGLAISRDLARGMRGDLALEESGAGARFVLRLPLTGVPV